jgi:hypothetical protein
VRSKGGFFLGSKISGNGKLHFSNWGNFHVFKFFSHQISQINIFLERSPEAFTFIFSFRQKCGQIILWKIWHFSYIKKLKKEKSQKKLIWRRLDASY